MKYSDKLIYAVTVFMRAIEAETGDLEDNAENMLDAFDPSLRRQLLVAMIKGDIAGSMTICVMNGHPQLKINAIKAVRSVTGYGLKEAKDVIDDCERRGVTTISGDWDLAQRDRLRNSFQGTGYELRY